MKFDSKVPVDLFQYEKGQFSADLSTLQGYGFHPSAFIGSLYTITGKHEQGFQMYNQRTKRAVVFKLVKTDRDATGEDTYGWRYSCIAPKNLSYLTCLIVNT